MARKNNLLSIGEVAEYTNASTDSLRYYEQIKLLEPAYIDPDTKYRYYSFEQIYLIEIIKLCVELNIPLKDLTEFIAEDKTVDYYGLLAYGKQIADKKLESLQRGIKFINAIEKKIILTEKYPQSCGQIYSREIPKKYFCITPWKKSFTNAEPFEVIKASQDLYYYEDSYGEWLYYEMLEHGFLCRYSCGEAKYYMFAELPEHAAMNLQKNILTIPQGTYMCIKGEESQLEKASQIFGGHLGGEDSFIAIETDIFPGKFNIDKPVRELRILAVENQCGYLRGDTAV